MGWFGLGGSKPSAAYTVLLVEDEDENILLGQKLLQSQGIEVYTAKNGAEAITVARMKLPRLILMDIVMPVMDGLTCLQRLKADPKTKHIPVIMLSSRPRDADQAKSCGAKAMIAKPYDNDQFLFLVRQELGLPHPD